MAWLVVAKCLAWLTSRQADTPTILIRASAYTDSSSLLVAFFFWQNILYKFCKSNLLHFSQLLGTIYTCPIIFYACLFFVFASVFCSRFVTIWLFKIILFAFIRLFVSHSSRALLLYGCSSVLQLNSFALPEPVVKVLWFLSLSE